MSAPKDDIDTETLSLWPFTIERYGKPAVREAAIALQDNLGADVNFLFYCAWAAATGREPLSTKTLQAAESGVMRWRDEVTEPLRRLRNHIRGDPELSAMAGAMDARGKIVAAEIESEHVAQFAIEVTAAPPAPIVEGDRMATAEANLRTYLAHIEADLDQEAENHLQRFLSGVFSD